MEESEFEPKAQLPELTSSQQGDPYVNGDFLEPKVSPFQGGTDSSRAVYGEELQAELDKGGHTPNLPPKSVVADVRASLEAYRRNHGTVISGNPILDEQKEGPLLEDELLPPTPEVDMLALEKVRKNIPKYLTPRKDQLSSVKKYNFPAAERTIVSKTTEIQKEFRFRNIETAIISFLRGKTLVKDEIINLVSDHKDEISPDENRTRVTISGVIEDLLNRKRLVADREGKFSVVIAGGSTDSPDEENLPNQKWSLPTSVIGKFDEILANEHDPVRRKKLIAFRAFMEFASNPADFEKRLLEAKERGTFDTLQYNGLVSVLKMASDEFVPEPPPVVAQKIKSNPNVIMSDRPAVRIDTPLSFDDIKRMRQENPVLTIREGRKSEPVAGETPADKLIRETAQFNEAKISNDEVAKKIDHYLDQATFVVPLKELRGRLAQSPAEDMVEIITSSSALTEEQRNELLTILGVQVAIPGELPYPDGYVPEPPPIYNESPEVALSTKEKDPKVLIAEAQTFDELYAALRTIGTIHGSNKMYDADYLINTIEGLRQGALLHSITGITHTYGLRDKVAELLDREKNQHIETVGGEDIKLPEPSSRNETSIESDNVGEAATQSVPERSFKERMRDARKVAQPYDLAKKSFGGVYRDNLIEGPTRKEDLSPVESEKIERELRDKLDIARKKFVVYESAYKQQVREKKSRYSRVLEDLGAAEKQLPQMPPKDPEHVEAERAYLKTQWDLKNFIVGRDVKEVEFSYPGVVLSNSENKKIDVGVAKEMQTEWEILQREIQKNLPEKERSLINKAFEKWSSYSLPKRIALSTAVLAVGGVAFGGVGISTALAGGLMRYARAGLGAGLGVGAGKVFDGVVVKKKIEKIRNERLDEVGSVDTRKDEQAFINQVKEFSEKAQAEEKTKRKYQLAKAGVMAATSGVATIGMNIGAQAVSDHFGAPEPKGSWLDKFIKKEVVVEEPVAPKAPSVVEKVIETAPQKIYVTPVEVELSQNGFIDTVDKLKQATAGQKLTPALEKLFAQSPQKIAIDLGLFKPGQVAESAFGFQREQLAIDIDGNVSLMHSTGETEVLMDSQGTLKPYSGKMFDADGAPVSEVPKVIPEPLRAAAPVIETPPPVKTAIPDVRPEMGIKAGVSTESLAADGATVASGVPETKKSSVKIETGLSETSPSPIKMETSLRYDDSQQVRALMVGDIEIATPLPGFKNPQDILSGKMPLKSDLQFGSDGKIRTEYNKFFTKTLALMSDAERAQLFDYHLPVQYKGGRIDIFQKGEDITILLNGEKILSATMVDGKPGYMFERPETKGIFSVKSEYEIASDEAKKAIEKNIKFFNVKK